MMSPSHSVEYIFYVRNLKIRECGIAGRGRYYDIPSPGLELTCCEAVCEGIVREQVMMKSFSRC